MIYTVTLNPTLDMTFVVDSFSYGEPIQALEFQRNPGGKGVNVSRVLRALGEDSVAVALAGGFVGEEFLHLLQQEGLILQVVKISNPTRTNVVVYSRAEEREMVIRTSGPPLAHEEALRADELISGITHAPKIMVLSGSLPLGMETDTYRRIAAAVMRRGTRVVLDCSGEPLRLGIEACPHMIKPNLAELTALAGRELADEAGIVEYAREIVAGGVRVVVVSLGAAGALMVTETGVLRGTVPRLEEESVGAGDSMVAGIVMGITRGHTLATAFRTGLAASLATVMREGPLLADRDSYEKACSMVVVEEL